ncbi:redoxin family protein [Sunxiuqinia elliptica]
MRNLSLLTLVVLFFAACQSNSTQYKVSGTVAGLDSGIVYLVKTENGRPVTTDTTDLVNGEFSFEGSIAVPELYYLRLNAQDYFGRFFLENDKIEVTANIDSLQNTEITGSPSNDVFNKYLDEVQVMNEKMQEYQQQYAAARASGNEDEVKRIQFDAKATNDNMAVFAKNFVRENNTSVVAPFILLTQLSQQLEYVDLKELYDLFPAELAESLYMKELTKMIETRGRSAVGVQAPEFTMNDVDGTPVSLSSFKGKYLLIDFWASWCGPCRRENPNVVEAYQKYKDKGFDILGVSLDRDKSAWLKGIEEDQLTWTHVSDLKYWQNEVAQLYGVSAIPHSVLLDKDGKIIAKNLRGEDLHKKLEELLN